MRRSCGAQTLFQADEWRPELGHEPCVATRLPDARRAAFGEAAGVLLQDAELALQTAQIGHFGRRGSPLPAQNHLPCV